MTPEISFEVDDETYARLERLAAAAGTSLPDFVRSSLGVDTPHVSILEWLKRTRNRHSNITTEQVQAAVDERRGPWPEAPGEAP